MSKGKSFPRPGLPYAPWLCPWSSVLPEDPGASVSMGAGPLSQKLPRILTEAGREPSPGGALQASSVSLLSVSSAELLPHLGGLQLQGHEAAFPAEVRLLRVPPLGRGRAEGRTPHPHTVPLSLSPGPLCWLLWPSWMPSRKWQTWPPTPEVGRGRGWRVGMPQVGLGGWKG